MADTEFEFSDEALRAASSAARAARGNTRGNTRGGHSDTHRKRPRQDDERRCAGTARRRIAPQKDETMRRLFGALRDSTAKPICEGGLAHYFIAEAHRRKGMIERPEPRAASALSIPAVFDAIAAASHKDCKEGRPAGGDCPVCMQDASSDTIALPCGHAFHRRCIVSWLQLNSSCPCCRAPVLPSEPYRYPAKTRLQTHTHCIVKNMNDMSELENDISVLESVLRRSKIECTTVRLREMGTELMGTILTFASVPPRKMGTLLLGSWWP